jgi:two-component system OmpR family response regulator
LAVGGLRLDPLNRRVTRDDVDVDLTPREFALLEFLMRNAGRTMSRSRIAEAVWNYQFDPETNVVDVYINYLRKKIGSGNTVIQTVRGVGYRLEVP